MRLDLPPLPFSPGNPSCDAAGDVFRNVLGPNLSAADKQAIADQFGVDVRTVQRWATQTGTETREFCPAKYSSTPYDELPADVRARLDWLDRVRNGARQPTEHFDKYASFKKEFDTVSDAERFIRDARNGELDRWLNGKYRSMTLRRVGDHWELLIEYDRLGPY